jgi:hypothetical protein
MRTFTVITNKKKMLNVSLQGQNKLVSDLGQIVFSFQNKLKLFIRDLKSNNFTHFSCLEKIEQCLIESEIKINCDDYALKLEFLILAFVNKTRAAYDYDASRKLAIPVIYSGTLFLGLKGMPLYPIYIGIHTYTFFNNGLIH